MRNAVPSKWIRNPSDERAVADGCTFDERAGQFVVDFIERFCKQSQGEWAGREIELLDWQRDFLMRLYAWKKPNGLRRFKSAYLEVAKKNGKSTLCSALLLYHLMVDGEAGAKCYIGAYDGEQAKLVYEESVAMVQQSPSLASRLEIEKRSQRIVYASNRSFASILTSDAAQKEGKNASFIIFDELHTQKSRRFWDSLRYAFAARRQPLRLSITTAGEDEEGIWFEERQHSEKVNNGSLIDQTHLGVVYRAKPDEDFRDPEVWKRANPSLGRTISLESFKEDLESALMKPAEWAQFLRYRFNVITKADTVWLKPNHWALCGLRVDPEDYQQRPIWIGLDLSETTDLTAMCVATGDSESGVDIWLKFWMPSDRVQALEGKDNATYRLWINEGWIQEVPGSVIDYGWIKKAILDLSESHDLKLVNADPWNARQLLIELRDTHGLEVCETRQGFTTIHPLINETERAIMAGKLRHGCNPVLDWMAAHATTIMNQDGLKRLVKPKKGDEKEKGTKARIDGIIAMVLAVGACLIKPAEDHGGAQSVYETQEVRWL